MDKYTLAEKKEVAKKMIIFCERLWDEFNEFYESETGDNLNEDIFDEMIRNINNNDT